MVQKPILIIPAAGLATRLRPLTGNTSKCMIPVNGKPTISYILDMCYDKYEEIIVVYGKNDDVKKFCEKKYPKVVSVQQETPLGPLHAVHIGLEAVKDKRFVHGKPVTIWLGDTIVRDYDFDLTQNTVVVGEVPDFERWCMIGDDGALYDKVKERPPTNKALVGIYTFKEFFEVYDTVSDLVKLKKEYEIAPLLNAYGNKKQFTTNQWYDVGDLPSLYDSKARLLTLNSREENKIEVNVDRASITKSGPRIANEIEWYKEVIQKNPRALPFIPQIYSYARQPNDCYYEMSYCSGTTLQETFAFEDIRPESVKYVMNRVFSGYSSIFKKTSKTDLDTYVFFFKEKKDRVNAYNYEWISEEEKKLYNQYVDIYGWDFSYVYTSVVNQYWSDFVHGDLHFGNILFDYQAGMIKFIDPRGKFGDKVTTKGNAIYDFAKLAQSFVGDYLWIKTDTEVDEDLKNACIESMKENFTKDEFNCIMGYVPILMGSILDFHKDKPEHQKKIWNKTISLIIQNEHRVF